MTGWAANAFILVGMYLIGEKVPYAFGFSIVGESIWCYHAYTLGMFDLSAICALFCVVAGCNWVKWSKAK